MVATVIAQLDQAGRLALDDPVTAHVPELRAGGWAREASLRDLLANRSGLPLREELEFGFAARPEDDDAALARLAGETAAGSPLTDVWSYTNVGWCVLGRVIETVTGLGWEAAMRRHLFTRADMSCTTFATAVPRRADRGRCAACSGRFHTAGRVRASKPAPLATSETLASRRG
jgi:CubicO group peptidase (beta-lactamase class C family)